MTSPLVSVVIPAYNAGRFIEEAVQSVLSQSHRQLELLVVDDGSTDNTADLVRKLASGDPRVRLISQRNAGVSAARNAGAAAARGEYIAILDADDAWHPSKIEAQLRVFQESPAAKTLGLVYCRCAFMNADSQVTGRADWPVYSGDVYPVLILGNFAGGGSAALIPRAVWKEVGGFDIRLSSAADLAFCLAIAERYDFGFVDDYLMTYRVTSTSMSHQPWEMFQSMERVLRRAKRRHPELPPELFRWGLGESANWLAQLCESSGRNIVARLLRLRARLVDRGIVEPDLTRVPRRMQFAMQVSRAEWRGRGVSEHPAPASVLAGQ